jgi:RNA polymerase sigma factor (sigma-70 family)
MQDAQMVEAILAGQEAGLAAAYDRYAASLYDYCHSLLAELADAAAAVQDTFIVAADGLGGLRDPARLRPWLYAVARNECHRRLRTRPSSAPLDEVGETAGVSPDTPNADLNAQAGAALAGLSLGDREIIELNLRHDLTGRDLADVLGVSPNQAHALASRTRSEFERSLGVRRGLDTTVLLGPLPVASAAPPPAGLRDQLLRLVGDFSPVAASYRAEVINRAGPFGRSGFPRPLDPPRTPYRPKTPALAATAGIAAVVVIAGFCLPRTGSRRPARVRPDRCPRGRPPRRPRRRRAGQGRLPPRLPPTLQPRPRRASSPSSRGRRR